MGSFLSHIFASNSNMKTISHLFNSYPTGYICDTTKQIVSALLVELNNNYSNDANHINWNYIHETYLELIPKGENLLLVIDCNGYNILQRAVSLKSVELTKWLLGYGCDCNRGTCSLPLHIATLNGPIEIVELLVKYGARVDCEARMCYPGPHSPNCELGRRSGILYNSGSQHNSANDRLQSADYYAIDGDQASILEYVMVRCEDNWLPWQCQKKPLLHSAFERGAWNCVNYLISERPDEINQLYDEYFPIHQAVLQDIKFLELLIQCNADLTQRTSTQQLTVLHVLLLLGKKSSNETLATLKLLFEMGCKQLVNEPDSLGNTPLHALIVRYSLEESQYNSPSHNGSEQTLRWTTWDMLHIFRFILQQGVIQSINRKGNSALCCVLRHVKDWEFRFELLYMLLQYGADPNCVGRDGSVPLILCFTPLLNKGLLHLLSHSKKVSYLNCVRILCKYGANPNCSYYRNTLTPLHVLVFSASEYMSLTNCDKPAAFAFIRQVLTVLLQHKLDPNVDFSQRNQHILLALLDLVQNARMPSDLDYVHDLSQTLMKFGANPDVKCSTEPTICHSQSSVFLKRSSDHVIFYYIHYLLRKEELLIDDKSNEQHFSKLICLYYQTMSHNELYSCLQQLNKELLIGSIRCNSQELTSLLRNLSSNPRSLKSIARNTIYHAMGRE
ncbi:unnamed protein product, partial [Oppiella nova]